MMTVIKATDLARHTRKILDMVVIQGKTMTIERNHVAIAKIVPSEPTMTADQALKGFEPTLNPTQGKSWLKDSKGGGFGQQVQDPWE
jgi:antitoxin (DNA-binding transcriptional repressor) of toxin-antitoxin stability system